MKKIQTSHPIDNKSRFLSKFFTSIALVFMSMMISSCSVVGDIFNAGMSFGIFIVIAIIVIIVIIVFRLKKN